jgi:hypothetical protein
MLKDQTNPTTTDISDLSISWREAIDLLENYNKSAFEHFYNFHSIHGIRDKNLSPCERLADISDNCESTAENLICDFISAIIYASKRDEEDFDSYAIDEEGFHF